MSHVSKHGEVAQKSLEAASANQRRYRRMTHCYFGYATLLISMLHASTAPERTVHQKLHRCVTSVPLSCFAKVKSVGICPQVMYALNKPSTQSIDLVGKGGNLLGSE